MNVEDEFRYMIFRVYDESERDEDRVIFYGWTRDKNVKRAFLSQRDKKKYKSIKMYEDEINNMFSENVLDEDTMIDFVSLKFSSNPQEELSLFITSQELQETEKNIQSYFDKLSSLSGAHDITRVVQAFVHLDPYYADALHYIGFRPSEVDSMYPGVEPGEYEIDRIEYAIESAYDGSLQHPEEEYVSDHNVPGLSIIEDVAKQILYSVESFIKALRKDL